MFTAVSIPALRRFRARSVGGFEPELTNSNVSSTEAIYGTQVASNEEV